MSLSRNHTMRWLLITLMCLFCGAAIYAASYSSFRTGTLTGKLIVQWRDPDVFLFLPDPADPLTFTRRDGTVIRPGRMMTDGGSIPRPLRAFKNYSPWGYAPAFVIHDWIFRMNYCQLEGYRDYNVQKAADVMAEIIKTMMESGKVEKDELTVRLLHTAVSSPIAKRVWDEGRCQPLPPTFGGAPIYEFLIDFSGSASR